MKWIACDTETFTYVDGIKLDSNSLDQWSLTHEESHIRSHAAVQVWGWLAYGRDGFHNFQSFNEFCEYLIDEKIEQAWFHNAKFDFAEIDWQVLSDEKWTHASEKDHPAGWWWDDLHGDQGERYSFTIGKGDTCCKFYDTVNFFKTTLENLLIDFDVRDEKNEPIRKLTMDYQVGDNEEYLVNDVKGLYFAVKKIDEKMIDLFGQPLVSPRPFAITASGLAKKIFLTRYYKKSSLSNSRMIFQRRHAISCEKDLFWRKGMLYRGGLVLVNPYLAGKPITRRGVRVDCNSMYPAQIKKMREITGNALVTDERPSQHAVEVIDLQCFAIHLKPSMIPCFTDPTKNKMTAHFEKICERGEHFFMFREELRELQKWYDIDYDGFSIFFNTKENKAFSRYVDDFYQLKKVAKEEKNKVTGAFAKLLLNGLGGKFAENPIKNISERVLRQGACRLDTIGVYEEPTVLLDVRQGALMTSMARVNLLSTARMSCNNVAKDLFYTDTDSIHGVLNCEKIDIDDYRLGAWKKEADVIWSKFLAPKTYIEKEADGTLTVHAKGCPQKSLDTLFKIQKDGRSSFTVEEIDRLFSPGQTVNALHAMNIVGGKGLFLRPKQICKPSNQLITDNMIFEP